MSKSGISIKRQDIAENAIRKIKKEVNYNSTTYNLEYFLNYISQEDIVAGLLWTTDGQSRFIESLLIDLPVMRLVIYDPYSREVENNRSELQIIDGKQKLYTAINFIRGNLKLLNLKKLPSLNGFKFDDLVPSRQRSFVRITVRTIEIDVKSNLSYWLDNFY